MVGAWDDRSHFGARPISVELEGILAGVRVASSV